MVHAPLRGLFALTRLGLVAAAAVAIPVILKRNKGLANKLGDAMVKAGEKLKGTPEKGPEDAKARKEPASKAAEPAKAKAAKPRTPKAKPSPKKASRARPAAKPRATKT